MLFHMFSINRNLNNIFAYINNNMSFYNKNNFYFIYIENKN